jgi:D-amino peptidase
MLESAGVLGHTFTYSVTELRLNGTVVGESGLSAAIASHFGALVVLVSGDAHAVRQAKNLIKNLVGVSTKKGVGLYPVRTLTPDNACELIRKGANEALGLVGDIETYTIKKPVMMEVEFERPLMAQYVSRIPLAKRKDFRSVAFKAADMVGAVHVFELMNQVASYAKDEGPL